MYRSPMIESYHGWNSIQIDRVQYLPAAQGQGEKHPSFSGIIIL